MSLEVPAALLLGLLGSVHCAVMCGPLALALPVAAGRGRGAFALGRLGYNLGRATTYTLLGIVVGLLGHGVRLAGLQRALSIGAGVVILVHLALRAPALAARLGVLRRALPAAPLARWSLAMQRLLAPRLQGRAGSLWVFGMLNGLLPCGLVGVGLAGAAATGSALGGGRFMLLFGLGTLPLMLATALFGGAASARYGRRLQRWAPVALGILALLFLVRGIGVPMAHAATSGGASGGAHAADAPACPMHPQSAP